MLISALLTKAVWARSQQRGAALLLLLALASYANRQGWAWPKLSTLPSERRRSRYRLVARRSLLTFELSDGRGR